MSPTDPVALASELARLKRLRNMRLGGLDHGQFTVALIDELDQRIDAIKAQLCGLTAATPHAQHEQDTREKDL